MAKNMSIQEALLRMDEVSNQGKTFTLTFHRSTSPNRGEKVVVLRCVRGVPEEHVASERRSALAGIVKRPLQTDRGVLPLKDLDRDKYFTPKISHIVGFDNYKIIH